MNILKRNDIYRFSYKVAFDRDVQQARFGMLIKTINGLEIGGLVSHSENEGDVFKKDQVISVTFHFKALMQPGCYFLNAGVKALENNEEIYLHRLLDILMFRVDPIANNRVTCHVDLSVEPLFEVAVDVVQ